MHPPGDSARSDLHTRQISRQIEEFRKQLLGLTLRNPLLNFRHGTSARTQIRVIDELPDAVFERLEEGADYSFKPLPEPRLEPDDEGSDEFLDALDAYRRRSETYRAAIAGVVRQGAADSADQQLDREARDHVRLSLGMEEWSPEADLSPAELCRRHGIDPGFDLPVPGPSELEDRHRDRELQTRYEARDLERRSRLLRDRSQESIRQKGVGILYAAFGFLEWFESPDSTLPRHAPLVMVPVELGRKLRRSRYEYTVTASGEEAVSNLALAVYLRQRFGVQLPSLDEDDSPESYFEKISEFCAEIPRWRLRRYITLATFGYSKISIYQDIDPANWPQGSGPAEHRNIRELLAQSGVSDVPFAEDRDIDEDTSTRAIPILAFEADSSQHSAVADVLAGSNLTIYGPPGTGKSQTIANAILASMAAGKSVLFVAEKLTALEVVQDRIEKAGFGPFCLNLHGRNSKPTAVRRQLSERINCHPPQFDESKFERNKEEWTRRRDALQSYAGIVGAKIGRLGATVHDVLWRELNGRELDVELPRELATLTLPDVESVDAVAVNEARSRLDQLAGAKAEFERTRTNQEHPAWQGIRRIDLSLPELGPAFNLAQIWREHVEALVGFLEPNGLPLGQISINDLNLLIRISESAKEYPAGLMTKGPAVLASARIRGGLVTAAERATELDKIGKKLASRFGLVEDQAIETGRIRRIWQIVGRLEAKESRIGELEAEIEALRHEVAALARHSASLATLRNEFGVGDAETDVDRVIAEASRLLGATGTEVLQARAESLSTRSDCAHARAVCEQINDLASRRSELAERFDLDRLPTNAELLAAADSLHMLRGPVMFSRSARRALKLHRQISLGRQNSSPGEAAIELRAIAQFRKEVTRLQSGVESRRTFGRHWKGLDTDVNLVGQLANWVEVVYKRFGGTSGGRPQIREVLLKAESEQLAEISRIASSIPAESELGGIANRAKNAEKRISLICELASIARELNLDRTITGSQIWELVRLLEAAQALGSDSRTDAIVSEVFGAEKPRLEVLAAVASVASGISSLDSTDKTLGRVLDCHRRVQDPGSLCGKLPGLVSRLLDSWQDLSAHLKIKEPDFFGGSAFMSAPIARIAAKSEICSGARAELGAWCSYQRSRESVQRSHAAAVLDVASGSGFSDDRLRDVYDRAIYRALAASAFKRYPMLHEFSSGQLGNHRQAFKELEELLLGLERQRIADRLYQLPVEHGVSFGGPGEYSEKALLQHWLPLKRSRVTVRDLCRRAGKAMRQLKPCFLMSPTTVAEFIPNDAEFFDVVVIDEASQMLPSDALGSIARGKQCVVVGDPKQLPPTTFFGGSPVDDDDQGDEAQLAAVAESILDLALSAWRPPRHLRWHYRSRHSGLIKFSNSRFYDNQLIVFPGPDEADESGGVKFNYVAEGQYQPQRRGGTRQSRGAGNRNPAEAAAVVKSACEFMSDPGNRDLSLAIVAVNRAQRDLIAELLDRESERNLVVRRYRQRWESTLFPLMVSHLEAVQGDERDVVFISTVYGPETQGGPVRLRFGPITHAGGERRLNVLFTRAKHRVEVFSSMRANDIRATPSSSEGVQVLRDYLEYAATGRIEVGLDTGDELESPFEEHVLTRLLEKGYEVDPQVGVAGYRIDLGLKHPEYPHGYLLGIECDGATYHSARSVRDRDRAREAVLRDLGWEIYRIWSTDWFSDPDYEIKRLVDHIESLAAEGNVADEQEEGQALVAGRPDDPIDDRPAGTREIQAPVRTQQRPVEAHPQRQELADGGVFVVVGDTVLLHYVGRNAGTKRVTIVRGPTGDSDGLISDDSPIARALLGASIGEYVTVSAVDGPCHFLVADIERQDSELFDESDSGAIVDEVGVELSPYREWRGDAPDPRSTRLRNVASALHQIIEVESPVLESRAYRAYAEASGARRLGAHFVRLLKQALALLESAGRIRIDRGVESDDRHGAVLHVHGGDTTTIRDIGPRDFTEIPLSELSALIGVVQANHSSPYLDDIFRSALGCYGLTRMTKKIDLRFKQAMAFSASGPNRPRFGSQHKD